MTLGKIKKVRLNTIMELVSSLSVKDKTNIKNIYNHNYIYFQENLDFLILLELVKEMNNLLSIKNTNINFVDATLDKICCYDEYFNKTITYLGLFNNLEFTIFPTVFENSIYYDERTFLVDIDLATTTHESITIVNDRLKLFIINKRLTLGELFLINERKIKNGLIAESIALEFELYEATKYPNIVDVNQIQQISSDWANAGYDIIGFDKHAALLGEYRPIFIEVKSIQLNSMRFYWSSNEISISKKNSNSYYLYLIDILEFKKSGFNSIICIQNPYNDIFCTGSKWVTNCESIIVSLEDIYDK